MNLFVPQSRRWFIAGNHYHEIDGKLRPVRTDLAMIRFRKGKKALSSLLGKRDITPNQWRLIKRYCVAKKWSLYFF